MRTLPVFVDLDGVLADFDGGVEAVTGARPADLKPQQMWPRLARADGFYEHLNWLSDGRRLWKAVKPLNPVILTGLPRGSWAEPQKRAWCRRELGAEVAVITCLSREKAAVAQAWLRERATASGKQPEAVTCVLIDDRESLADAWTALGGIFVHHRDADTSIAALRSLGLVV